MTVTNEFERDLNNTSFLGRPGRVDLIVFQNTPDAGDGHPGVQRCFRNYLHEGGMEKDLQLVGYSIKGTSVDINNAELQQLSNIGTSVISANEWSQIANIGTSVITTSIWSQLNNIEATTISPTQWGYVGGADQPVKQSDSPTFNGLTLTSLAVNGNITITGTVDSVDVSDLKSSFDTHKASTGADHSYIDQSVVISASPQFAGLSLTGNLALAANSITGTSVDVNNTELQQLSNIGANTISGTQWGYLGVLDQNLRQADSPTFVGLTLSADLVTASTIDGVDVSTHTHSGAGQGGTVLHSSTGSKTANDHHNQSHILSGADHTASGLTVGHVIRASGATAFAWAQLGHSDLSGIGSNAHSVIDTHLSDHLKHNNINPFSIYGLNGFVLSAEWGPHWAVLCSDTAADVYASFIVQDIGTYRLHIVSSATDNGGATDYANGLLYLGKIAMGSSFAWNIANGAAANLLLWQYQPRPNDYEYAVNISITSENSIVYVKWHKNNNVNSRAGYFRINNIYLKRTA